MIDLIINDIDCYNALVNCDYSKIVDYCVEYNFSYMSRSDGLVIIAFTDKIQYNIDQIKRYKATKDILK